MKRLPEEQEVTIGFDKKDEFARLYSSDPSWIRKMDKLCIEQPENFECVERGEDYAKYKFPKKLASIRKGRITVELSAEEKQRRSEQIQAILAARANSKMGDEEDPDDTEDDLVE